MPTSTESNRNIHADISNLCEMIFVWQANPAVWSTWGKTAHKGKSAMIN